MRATLTAALLVLTAAAAQAQDLGTTFTALAQGAQAQAASRAAEAQSLSTVLGRLLSGLGTRSPAPTAPGDRGKPVLAAALSGPPRGTRSPLERP